MICSHYLFSTKNIFLPKVLEIPFLAYFSEAFPVNQALRRREEKRWVVLTFLFNS